MKKNLKCALYIVLILSPIIAGIIIGLMTGTSIFRLDEWNTTWNDEVGYYSSVRTMREIGFPVGYNGYNEGVTKLPSYGAYNYVTYLPFYFFSFFVGTASHNMTVYCNLVMIVLSLLVFVLLVKPSVKQSCFLSLLFMTHLIISRYSWSGMTETGFVALTIFVMAVHIKLSKCELKGKHWILLLFEILLIGFFGIIRPFVLAFLLFPLINVFQEKRRRCRVFELLYLAAISCISLGLYYWFGKVCCAPYFSKTTMIGFDEVIGIRSLIRWVVIRNIVAIQETINNFKCGFWSGCITIEFYFLLLLIGVETIKYIKKKDKNLLVYLAMLLVDLAIYEANVLMYTSGNFHRMLLPCIVASAIFLIFYSKKTAIILHEVVLLLVIMQSISVRGVGIYELAQVSPTYDTMVGEVNFEQILPRDERNGFYNTIAMLPQEEDLHYLYEMPTYMARSCCTWGYLAGAIWNDTLSSKYVWTKIGHEVTELCESKYTLIWDDGTWFLYDTGI